MNEAKLGEAVELCRAALADREGFDTRERTYKEHLAALIQEALKAPPEDAEFLRRLRRAFRSPKNILTNFHAHDPFLKWVGDHVDEGRKAVEALGDKSVPPADRAAGFLERVPVTVLAQPGSRISVVSFLLMGVEPDRLPYVRVTPFGTVERVLEWPGPPAGADAAALYAQHLAFAQWFDQQLRAAGVSVRDVIDVQGLIWVLAVYGEPQSKTWRGEPPIPPSPLERAMMEFEQEVDSDEVESFQARFRTLQQRYQELFGSPEAIAALTPELFLEFFNAVDTHGRTTDGLFTLNIPLPKNPATQAFQYLVPDMPALQAALKDLLHGSGSLAQRIDRVMAGERVRNYLTDSLAIPSVLLCFHDPDGHAGVIHMNSKRAKLEAAGALPGVPDGASLGTQFEAMERTLAELPMKRGREWDWARRARFYWSEAFRRNLESSAPEVDERLAELVSRFRTEYGYPTEADQKHIAAREEFAPYLTRQAVKHLDFPIVQTILSSSRYSSAGPQSVLHAFLKTAGEEDRERLRRAIEHLLFAEASLARRLDEVLTGELKVPGFGEAAAMKLLAICDPEQVVPVLSFAGPDGQAALMRSPELKLVPPSAGSRGELAQRANDLIHARLEPHFPGDPWGMARFLSWLRDRPQQDDGGAIKALAKELLLGETSPVGETFLEKVVKALRQKRQLIFYGPPGTGKTYIARKLMEYLAPDSSRREVVQFHPSYAYEDFVQGYRPETRPDGTLAYTLKPGPLLRLAERATSSAAEHVLLIDEINRGNLPKILGELLYLLEYRDDEVALMYGEAGERFSLPRNLLIIGTMNTADRSIGLIDAALRRRFHFIPLFPDREPLAGLLGRWLDREKPEMLEVAGDVDRLNARLRDKVGPHLQVGHSYFMREDLSEEVLRDVWDLDVMPFLEDQLFGQEQELRQYTLVELRKAASGSENDPAQGVPEAAGAPEPGGSQPAA